MRTTTYNDATEAEAYRLREVEGLAYWAIAQRLGISVSGAVRACKRRAAKLGHPHRKRYAVRHDGRIDVRAEPEQPKIIAAYLEGVPVRELVGRFRLSQKRIYAILHEGGIELGSCLGRQYKAERDAEIAEQLRAGVSPTELAERYGVKRITIYAVKRRAMLRERGLSSRTPSRGYNPIRGSLHPKAKA